MHKKEEEKEPSRDHHDDFSGGSPIQFLSPTGRA